MVGVRTCENNLPRSCHQADVPAENICRNIVRVLETGEVIESYPQDLPYPSRLVLGWSDKRPVHAVVAEDSSKGETIVITAYEPDSQQWGSDYKRRRK